MRLRSWSSVLLSGVLAFSLMSCGGGGGDSSGTQNPDAGTLDTSFGVGGNGVAIYDPGTVGLHHVIRAIHVDSSDRIVAVGYQESALGDRDFLVMRFTADGEADSSFGGGDGFVTTSFGTTDEEAYAVDIQSNGRIVVVGEEDNFGHQRFAMARYLANGDLDSEFSGDGKLTDVIQNAAGARGVAIRTDGKIVVGGWVNSLTAPFPIVFGLTRLTSTGGLDGSFGTDAGYTFTPVGPSHDRIHALTLQSDEKIVVAGYSYTGTKNIFAVARYSENGILDPTFSGDGMLTTDVDTAGKSEANAVAMDGTRIVVGGYSYNGFTEDFAVARYTSTGAPDTSFNTTGKVTTDVVTGEDDRGHALVVTAEHKIVAVGMTMPSTRDFALARYNENGSLDTSMQGTGKWIFDVDGGHDEANAVAIQGSKGKIVIAGYGTTGADRDVVLARIWP